MSETAAGAETADDLAPALDASLSLPPSTLFSSDELAMARRLVCDLGKPPSDHINATSLSKKGGSGALVWRCRPEGCSFDSYVFEAVLPCALETFVQMSLSVESRAIWDDHTKKMEILKSQGPMAELAAFHGAEGDHLTLYWQVAAPFPLSSREYYFRRRLGVLPAYGPSGSAVLFLVDVPLGSSDPVCCEHKVPRRTVRVSDYYQHSVLLRGKEAGTTILRNVYREDPV